MTIFLFYIVVNINFYIYIIYSIFFYKISVSDTPILHLIPYPFPIVWHKSSDNRNNIDLKTTENINKILRIFVASYLHINI